MAGPSDGVIDFAVHHYPPDIVTEERRDNPFWDHLGSIPYDEPRLVAELDAGGVNEAVLSMPTFMGYDDAETTSTANDNLLETVASSDRFYGLASLPVAAGGRAAAREFERSLEIGFHGAAIETRTEGVELTDEQLEPVFEVADRTGAPVLVHPTLHDSIAPDALDDDYFLNAIWGREVALATSVSKVIHEDLMDRYPNLTLVFHHLGGNIATMLGRIEIHGDSRRWPFKEHLLTHDEFCNALENIYVDTAGYYDRRCPVRTALEEFPRSNVLFGTDLPFEARSGDDVEAYRKTVQEVASAATARRVLRENALEILVNVK